MDRVERVELVRAVFQKVAEKLKECDLLPSPAIRDKGECPSLDIRRFI